MGEGGCDQAAGFDLGDVVVADVGVGGVVFDPG